LIIKKDKSFETNSMFPSSDWYNEGNILIDETTQNGKKMAKEYIENYPFVDFKNNKVSILEKPTKPSEKEGKEIKLEKDTSGNFVYIEVDKPLSELEQLRVEVAELKNMLEVEYLGHKLPVEEIITK